MNVLDEQVRTDQRNLLKKWRIHVRQIGKDIAPAGIQDELIIPFLLTLKRPTLFTEDQGFFNRTLVHRAYALIWLDVGDIEVAEYIRRFLRHRRFNTHSKRLGAVARVRHGAVHFWQYPIPRLQKEKW
ncbi:MAG TPA: hypothetical protein VJ063_10030 [Verrucomicrobiae bacterium]|nr:hypothetical protein [Verrucomicrobiae bacterium]